MRRTGIKVLRHFWICFSQLLLVYPWTGCSDDLQTLDTPTYWPVDSVIYETCSGVEPISTAGDVDSSSQPAERARTAVRVGQLHPDWSLRDYQPKSCGFEQEYGLSSFRGRVVVLALLASW